MARLPHFKFNTGGKNTLLLQSIHFELTKQDVVLAIGNMLTNKSTPKSKTDVMNFLAKQCLAKGMSYFNSHSHNDYNKDVLTASAKLFKKYFPEWEQDSTEYNSENDPILQKILREEEAK
jgi:hypothetical protein